MAPAPRAAGILLFLPIRLGLRIPCVLFPSQRPAESRNINGSGSSAFFMRACTAGMSYGTRQNSTSFFEFRNGKRRARISIARLADGTGIQQIGGIGFDGQRRKQASRLRFEMQHADLIITHGETALQMGVPEKSDGRERIEQAVESLRG